MPREPHDQEHGPRSLDCKTHEVADETVKKREKARVELRVEAEAEALLIKPQ